MPSSAHTPQPTVDAVNSIVLHMIVIGSHSGLIAALDVNTGASLWSADVAPDEIDEVGSLGDAIYMGGHSLPNLNEDQPSSLTALDARDGALLWSLSAPGLNGKAHASVDAAMVVISSHMGDGVLVGAHAGTGAVVWTSGAGTGVVNRLITAKRGIAYVWEAGFPPHFVALETSIGDLRWRYDPRSDAVAVSPDGRLVAVFAVTSARDASLILLDANGGARLAEASRQRGDNLLAITDDGVAYLHHRRDTPAQISAFDLTQQAEAWRTGSDVAPGEHDVIFPYQLVVSAESVSYAQYLQNEGVVEVGALDAQTGAQRWRSHMNATQPLDINANRLVGGMGAVYLATDSGLRAFHLDDGHLLWHALPSEDLSFITPTILTTGQSTYAS